MKDRYTEDGSGRFLVRTYRSDETDPTEIRMLTHNRPEGLLPMRFTDDGEELTVRYTVSGLETLRNALDERNREALLFRVIRAVAAAGETAHAYFLSMDRLALSPEYIFLDSASEAVYFLYEPVSGQSFRQSVQALMEYFLKVLNPREEDKVLLLYGLYQKSREENVSPDTLARFLEAQRLPDSALENLLAADFPDTVQESSAEELLSDSAEAAEEANAFFDRPEGTGFGGELLPPPGEPSDRLREFVRAHGPELLIAAVVLIGIILFILI